MVNEELYELIADYCAGRLSEEGAVRLRRYVDSDPDAKEEFLRIRGTDKRIKSTLAPGISGNAWESIQEKIGGSSPQPDSKPDSRRWLRRAFAVAASVLVASLIYVGLNTGLRKDRSDTVIASGTTKAILSLPNGMQIYLDGETDRQPIVELLAMADDPQADGQSPNDDMVGLEHIVSVPAQGKYDFTLSDGTRIYMNSSSEVRFPKYFHGTSREIHISGEVFLDVAPDQDRPFIVHFDQGRIEVLGTRFNVSAYPEDKKVITTLISGSVEFTSPNHTELMTPGEQVIWGTESDLFLKKVVDTELYTSWIDDVYQFEKKQMYDIASQFSRWYGVIFVFESEELGRRLFTGTFDRQDNLDDILRDISKTTDILFDIRGTEIVVRLK